MTLSDSCRSLNFDAKFRYDLLGFLLRLLSLLPASALVWLFVLYCSGLRLKNGADLDRVFEGLRNDRFDRIEGEVSVV